MKVLPFSQFSFATITANLPAGRQVLKSPLQGNNSNNCLLSIFRYMNNNLIYIPLALILIIQFIGIYDKTDRGDVYLYVQYGLLGIMIIMTIYYKLIQKKK